MRDDSFVTAWLRLAFTTKVGPKTFEKLLKKFNNPISVLENLIEIKRRYKLDLSPPAVSEVEDSISKCYTFGGDIILSCDDLYPAILKEIEGYPAVLFAKGNTQLLKRNKISIVGTRNSSINGEKNHKKYCIRSRKKWFCYSFWIGSRDRCSCTLWEFRNWYDRSNSKWHKLRLSKGKYTTATYII